MAPTPEKKTSKSATDKTVADKGVSDTPKAATKTAVTGFELEDGRVFVFTDNAPKTLNVLGKVSSLSELIKNKNSMEYLIFGKSCFVKLLRK